MNYKRIYDQIIQNRISNPLTNSEYGQKHHILPRSLYPDKVKDSSNIIKLSYREHYICHWLLTKIYPCKKMISAFWLMNNCQNNLYVNSYAYTQSRNEYVKSMSGENHPMFGKKLSEEHKRKQSVSLKGRKHSEETKQKIRKNRPDMSGENHPMFGKKLSEEHKRKISQSHFGLKHSEETKQKLRKNHVDMSGENNPFYGKKHTEESRKKMSKALSGEKHPRAKKVLCIETNIVYLTIKDAVKKTGIRHICGCCKGRLKQAGGYHWKYVDEVKNEEKQF